MLLLNATNNKVVGMNSQLSLLSSVRRKMGTSQNVVTLCVWGVKEGMTHSICALNVWVADKTVRSLVNRCHT